MGITFGYYAGHAQVAPADAAMADGAVSALFRFLSEIGRNAGRKGVKVDFVSLTHSGRVSAERNGAGMAVKFNGVWMPPVDEITEWRIGVNVGRSDRILLHCVCIFHTFDNNRSGQWVYAINGKSLHLKPELGGWSLAEELAAKEPAA